MRAHACSLTFSPTLSYSVSEQKKIRERYLAIMKGELNGDPNLWHQNGLSFEPLMSVSDGNVHVAFIADYIALYRDPISIHCNDCQGNFTPV